jgi:hypothetical protein
MGAAVEQAREAGWSVAALEGPGRLGAANNSATSSIPARDASSWRPPTQEGFGHFPGREHL